MYICIHLYVYLYTYTYAKMYIYIYTYIYKYIYTYIYTYTYMAYRYHQCFQHGRAKIRMDMVLYIDPVEFRGVCLHLKGATS